MRSIKWLCCRLPLMTPNLPKPPLFLHFALPFERLQIWWTGWSYLVPAHGRASVPEMGVVTSCDHF